MSRTIVSITPSNVELLPKRCLSCRRFSRPGSRMWEQGGMAEWLDGVVSHWGACWKTIRAGQSTTCAALYAPPPYFTQAGYARASSVSEDAVMLACVYVVPGFRGHGLGKALMQSVEKDLLRRNVRAIEVLAHRDTVEEPAGPADFFLGQGFYVVREHPEFTQLRLDLKSLVTWPLSIQTVLESVKAPSRGTSPVAGRI